MAATLPKLDLNGPGIEPPLGVKSNFEHPSENYQNLVLMTLILCLSLSTVFVGLRVYIRVILIKSVQWEDYTCVAAWCCYVIFCGFFFDQLNNGIAIHMWDIPLWKAIQFQKVCNWIETVYMPTIALTKTSILLQLGRIFVPDKKSISYRIILALIVMNVLFFISCFFLEIFGCMPRERIWDKSVEGTCLDIALSFIVTATINIVSDLAMLFLPLYWVSQLQMNSSFKIRVTTVFATGIFACVASIMRLVESIRNVSNGADRTYNGWTPVALWATGEIASGLIVCSLPVMPRLWRHVASHLSGSGSAIHTPGSKQIPRASSKMSSSKSKTPLSNTWRHKDHDDLPHRTDYVELKDMQRTKTTVTALPHIGGGGEGMRQFGPKDGMTVETTFSVSHS